MMIHFMMSSRRKLESRASAAAAPEHEGCCSDDGEGCEDPVHSRCIAYRNSLLTVESHPLW